ncbi:MAG: hypothetical protein IKN20_03790 [Firmicutes bacterium]|nr:hypothetical protein [Bacillota bacterium]
MIDVRANNIGYSSGTASLVMTALQDGTKIRYPAQFYNAVELDEDPLLYETVKKGEARDFAKSGNIQRALLFGVNAERCEYNEYNGFTGYDWGRSYSLFFSGTGTPYGMVKATDSDVLVVGLKDMVRCDPIVLRAYDKTFYDKSGAKLDYYDSQGLSAIELECEATVSTPETMDVLLVAYDEDGRMLSCEHKQIKRTDLGPALKIPCSIGTDAERIVLLVVDKEFKPLNLLLDLTW